MFHIAKISAVLAVVLMGSSALVSPAQADVLDIAELGRGGVKGPSDNGDQIDGGNNSGDTGTYQTWMSGDIEWAWAKGGYGQDVTITVVDDFKSPWGYYGSLVDDGPVEIKRHGEWTLLQASMIAPQARMVADHWSGRDSAVKISNNRLDVINASYGMIGSAGATASDINWKDQEQSIIDYAKGGLAFVSKAAGNDYGTVVGQATADGEMDYLNLALIGAPTAIFVGALSTNNLTRAGDVLKIGDPAAMASYSNIAGGDTSVQSNFLVVGVDPIDVTVGGSTTGLYGTSFAAPIVAGYAAIVGSKFGSTDATFVANRLLDTAISESVAFAGGYEPNVHGQGIACISCAVAPDTMN